MNETQASRTTKTMAYLLMGLFGVCLVAVLVTAIWMDDDKRWYATFKDGFAFLAGALATIIGYYFGNRNTDAAFEKAKESADQAKVANEKQRAAETIANTLKNEIVGVTRSDDPVNPTNSPVLDEGALDIPR
jgi:uncharacterized membrane-anchored protein YitT (DUF2179 family)